MCRTRDQIDRCKDATSREYLKNKFQAWSTQYNFAYHLLEEHLQTPYLNRSTSTVKDAISQFQEVYKARFHKSKEKK